MKKIAHATEGMTSYLFLSSRTQLCDDDCVGIIPSVVILDSASVAYNVTI